MLRNIIEEEANRVACEMETEYGTSFERVERLNEEELGNLRDDIDYLIGIVNEVPSEDASFRNYVEDFLLDILLEIEEALHRIPAELSSAQAQDIQNRLRNMCFSVM